jgi:UDP-N-acetylmuramate: L-alanyl-gamma-D-glutamyl-meso-diaminopimelate ligase
LDIYLIAIGGTGMAPLACLLQEQGHRVRGADGPLYPPMSTLLAAAGIVPAEGYDPAHLEPRPDLVVVGNAVARTNVEAQEVERLGLPRLSMPEALARFFLADRRPLVVAGTHGKTTTTALAAWVYAAAGGDPGFLIGGVPRNFPQSFRRGSGPRFIVEGDEYNAAYFDRGPKFLHYRPHSLILTSVEYDHADLYPSPEKLREAYAALIDQLPPHGVLVACGDSPEIRDLAARAACPVRFYGLAPGSEPTIEIGPRGAVVEDEHGSRARVPDPLGGEVELVVPLAGRHNLANALAVWTMARLDALPAAAVLQAIASFEGVRRRLEEVGCAGDVVVVDDFAHHPTAVATTLDGIRRRYRGRRLVVLFEPRSLTAGRSFFFASYVAAFARADRVVFAPIFHAGRLAAEDRLDLERLTAELAARGVPATAAATDESLFSTALAEARAGDVVVCMSSGSFAGIPARLAAAIAARSVAGSA